jgi:hypothetical protein
MNPSRRLSRPLAASIHRANAADHAAALGVMGLLTKPSFSLSKMFAPTELSSAPSSPALILAQRSSLRSLTGWQACCGDFVVLARSKPASLRSRATFCPRAGKPRPAELVNWACCKPPPRPMGIAKPLARTDVRIGRPETKNCCRRLCVRCSDHPALSPNVSCASPILALPCWTAWAAMKRGYGVKRRKPSGPLKSSDGRHRLRRGGGFGNRQGFLIGMPSAETEMRPPSYRLSKYCWGREHSKSYETAVSVA